jgi:uncharacterized protein (DUF433 family)
MQPVISRSADVMSGAPVFAGTRVPIRALVDHLEAGDSLDTFLSAFPTVTREQAIALLELAISALTKGGDEAAA